MLELLVFLLGLGIRIGIPLALTLGLGYLVRRWLQLPSPEAVGNEKSRRVVNWARARNDVLHCWDIRKCPVEIRNACPAYVQPELPCWQAVLEAEGRLRPGCLTCNLYPLARVA